MLKKVNKKSLAVALCMSTMVSLYVASPTYAAWADADTVYTKTETESMLSTKADKTYVDGKFQNIDGQLDSLIESAANTESYLSAEVYNKGIVDAMVNAKADADTVYTKIETESMLSTKADKTYVDGKFQNIDGQLDSLIESAANTESYLSTEVYNKGIVDVMVNAKADADTVYTKTETEGKLSVKADKTYVDGKFQSIDGQLDNLVESTTNTERYLTDSVYNKGIVDAMVNAKADADTVYTKTETESMLSTKADKTYVDGKFQNMDGQLDSLIESAANTESYLTDEVYNKGTVDAMISDIDATKANVTDVYKKGETYSKAEVNTELDKKADKDAVYTKDEVYNKTEIDNMIATPAGIDSINQRLDKTNAKINKVGAGAAALAALHPLEYDPDDKLTFSAGMGNYAGENAAALGAFYRPNEKFMVSLGGTMGNGENMVNLGLSIGLDKPNGYAKLSKRELIQEVNAVKAENNMLIQKVDAVEAENEAIKAEMAEMKALLQAIMAKK